MVRKGGNNQKSSKALLSKTRKRPATKPTGQYAVARNGATNLAERWWWSGHVVELDVGELTPVFFVFERASPVGVGDVKYVTSLLDLFNRRCRLQGVPHRIDVVNYVRSVHVTILGPAARSKRLAGGADCTTQPYNALFVSITLNHLRVAYRERVVVEDVSRRRVAPGRTGIEALQW
jgi:hypothetical protein